MKTAMRHCHSVGRTTRRLQTKTLPFLSQKSDGRQWHERARAKDCSLATEGPITEDASSKDIFSVDSSRKHIFKSF